jgi:hypothetical protein
LESESEHKSQGSGVRGQEENPAQSSSPNQKSTIDNQQSEISSYPSFTDNRQQTTANSSTPSSTAHRPLLTDHSSSPSQHFSVSAFQLLPDIYRQAAPMLRCTSGRVFHVKIHDTAGLHGAFFEWDGTDTGSVLEAFRHMPEACMGAIGMQLVSKEKPILYTVRGQESGGRGQETEKRRRPVAVLDRSEHDVLHRGEGASGASESNQRSEVRGQEEDTAQSTSSTAHRSLITDHSLLFDHTVFRDPGQGRGPLVPGPLVHAFRAVWVAGTPAADARKGLHGLEFDQLRGIRLKAALTRYRPTHARVIQGAVRGFHTPEAAWAAFEEHMLRHLTLER